MSNKRINLTQFEHHSPAPWIITEDMQQVVIPANHESTMEMRLYTGSGTNSRLIAKAPDLIAELKKCYEEIDYLNALTNNLPVEMLVQAEQKLQASE